MFSPPPVMTYSPLDASKLTEPGLATLPMSACPEKRPRPVVESPKASFALAARIKNARTRLFIMDNAECSPFYRFEVTDALRNLLFRRRGFVFNVVPLYADFLRLAQNRCVINLPRPQRHVIGHVRMAGDQARRRAVAHSLQVHELPALAI